MDIFISILSSIVVGLYTGIVVMRISSFNQYRIYATEVMFGITSADAPNEADFEPEFIDTDENNEPIFQNVKYQDAWINYCQFGMISLGEYQKINLISGIFNELGHNDASLTCQQVYASIDETAFEIHKCLSSESSSEDHITPEIVHENRFKWERAILNIKPNLWAVLKPYPNSRHINQAG